MLKTTLRVGASACLVAGLALVPAAAHGHAADDHHPLPVEVTIGRTHTPIHHVVVIFQENVSYDHYFGTYPHAANTDGQPFTASPSTPANANLLPATDPSLPASLRHSDNLLVTNPNAALPRRFDSSPTGITGGPGGQLTCDQDHNYSDEQQAVDGGKTDRYVQSAGTASGTSPGTTSKCQSAQVMDYYDGNTVTGLWNYAQHFAMSDNSYSTTYGPSSPGAISLVSGNTGNVDMTHAVNNPSIATSTAPNADLAADGTGAGHYSLTSDAQPYYDDCSTRDAVALTGTNIGDELNAAGLTWGWFQGGQRPSTSYAGALAATGAAGQPTSTFTPDQFKTYFSNAANRPAHSSNQALCSTVHPVGLGLDPAGAATGKYGFKDDYIPHHEPFDYYASTANPHHLTVATDASGNDTLAGLKAIGSDTQSYDAQHHPQFDTPNHQYDMSDFDQLVAAIQKDELPPSALPAVSFLKAPGYQDGHGAYSDPEDEQQFIAREINALMKTPDWSSTAVLINYDDSDGWYDHQAPPIVNPSLSPADNLTSTTFTLPTSGQCGPSPQTSAPLGGQQGRCGFGPRLPMILVSPFAARNRIDHNLSDQASIINFVEYNWGLPGISGSADQALAATNSAEGVPFDLAGLFRFRGERNHRLILDPATGQPVAGDGRS